jgi:hypothetical protein
MAVIQWSRIQSIDLVLHGYASHFLLHQLFLRAYLLDYPSCGLLLGLIRQTVEYQPPLLPILNYHGALGRVHPELAGVCHRFPLGNGAILFLPAGQ